MRIASLLLDRQCLHMHQFVSSCVLAGASCPGSDFPHLRHQDHGAECGGDGVRHEEGPAGQDNNRPGE